MSRRRHWDQIDVVIFWAFLTLSSCLFLIMRATSTTGDDPFDSPLYGWSWVLLPAVGAYASFKRPDGLRPLLWTVALFTPLVVGVALIGVVFVDPDDGASLWAVGEAFILFQAGLALIVSYAISDRSLRRREQRHGRAEQETSPASPNSSA